MISDQGFRCGTATKRRGAFTVIELLIVVTIIIILAVMLVATWPMVRERIVELHCRTNLSKCHKVMCEYGANNNGFLPPVTGSGSNGWNNFTKGGSGSMNYVVMELKDYGASADIFMCPAWPSYDDENSSTRRQWANPTGNVYVSGYSLFIGFWPWNRSNTDVNSACEQWYAWLIANARKKALRIDSPGNPPIMADEMNYDTSRGWQGFYHFRNRENYVNPLNSSFVSQPGGGGHTLFLSGAVDWFTWEELKAEAEATDHTPQIPFYPYDGFSRKGFAGWKPRDDQMTTE
jgi:type II secretory pathway pseudopilin PulG